MSQAQLTSSSTVLNLDPKLNRSRRESFAVQENEKLDMPTMFSPCFSFQISMCMLNEKTFVLSISQPVKGKTAYYI